MPTARAAAMVRQMRVLNDDNKTIAWLTVTGMSLAGKNGTGLPPRLSVTAVRGYQAQTGQIARCLAAAGVVTPAVASPLDDVLAVAGRHPGDYSSKINVKLTADMPARCALEEVLLQLLDTLEANVRRHDPGHRHRVPARPAGRRPAHPVGDQAVRRCAAGRAARGVRRRVQVAGRRDHPDPRPRRLPARLRRDGGRAAGRHAGRAGAVPPPSRPAPRDRAAGTGARAALPPASWTWSGLAQGARRPRAPAGHHRRALAADRIAGPTARC